MPKQGGTLSGLGASTAEGDYSGPGPSACKEVSTDNELSNATYRSEGRRPPRRRLKGRDSKRRGFKRRGNSKTESFMFAGESSDTKSSVLVGEPTDEKRSDDEYHPKNGGKRPATFMQHSRNRATFKKVKAADTVGRGKEAAQAKRAKPVSRRRFHVNVLSCAT